MTAPARYRRFGWLAALSVCIVLYVMLHLKVNAVHSEVVQAEREIVRLERANMMLETEFLTRSNQVQLARLNRINFGFRAPDAGQFIDGERQLAQFSKPRAVDAPTPIRLAGLTSTDGVPAFPKLVSPLTGEPLDAALIEGAPPSDSDVSRNRATPVGLGGGGGQVRVPLVSLGGDLGQ
ncbi:hypothetical protein [Aurantiacibacter flavus]|uniref:Cell division protein FtsL n=1 Tax=Aurantiacibacter flavus TaxID=3145232 RepID=A0ABV0CUK6_9SPHN